MKINIVSKDGRRFTYLSHHIKEHKVPLHLIEYAIEESEIGPGDREGIVTLTYDFDYRIGFNRCVKITEDDHVVMVTRGTRLGTTPMVKGRNPEPTSLLTLILSVPNHCVVTGYYGAHAPREPWDPSLTEAERLESQTFWSQHALIPI